MATPRISSLLSRSFTSSASSALLSSIGAWVYAFCFFDFFSLCFSSNHCKFLDFWLANSLSLIFGYGKRKWTRLLYLGAVPLSPLFGWELFLVSSQMTQHLCNYNCLVLIRRLIQFLELRFLYCQWLRSSIPVLYLFTFSITLLFEGKGWLSFD